VTSVSGRGVGMDVVKTNIEKIGGTIELDSKEGKGSTFTIKIPLTLAITAGADHLYRRSKVCDSANQCDGDH
jgi:two-component system chemotaxis sensor kinase CheA